jgi:hypothetical protein
LITVLATIDSAGVRSSMLPVWTSPPISADPGNT